MEKYLTLARDASASGDRIAAENFYQHAEHYYRILNANNQDRQQQQQQQQASSKPQANGKDANSKDANGSGEPVAAEDAGEGTADKTPDGTEQPPV